MGKHTRHRARFASNAVQGRQRAKILSGEIEERRLTEIERKSQEGTSKYAEFANGPVLIEVPESIPVPRDLEDDADIFDQEVEKKRLAALQAEASRSKVALSADGSFKPR